MREILGLTTLIIMLLGHLSMAEDSAVFEGVPNSYSECAKTESKYKTVSILKCDYSISTDKTNTPETDKFLQCLSQYPEYKELSELNCRYIINEGNSAVPKILQCHKSNGKNYYPGIFDNRPCVLRFYNPGYVLPKNFRECQSRGGEMSQTYMEQKTCRITIELCGENKRTYCPEVFNKKEAEDLLNACINSGGRYEKSLGQFAECELLFIDE